MKILAHTRITPSETLLNGRVISNSNISGIYREFIGNYPKFFKMDSLCRLGFVAAELVLKEQTPEQKENASIILFNRNGSLITDRNYQKTLGDDNYFPSPALFVYTLANIVTGEIAIRHKIYGETSFYVLPYHDKDIMQDVVNNAYQTSNPPFILTGWLDYDDDKNYLADIRLVKK